MAEDEKKEEAKAEKAEHVEKQVLCKHCGEACGNTGLCITCKENGRE